MTHYEFSMITLGKLVAMDRQRENEPDNETKKRIDIMMQGVRTLWY